MLPNPEKQKSGRVLSKWLLLLVLFLSTPAVLIALLLLFQAESWPGRLFAASVLVLYLAGCFLVRWLHKSGRGVGRASIITGVLGCAGFLICSILAPSGVTPIGSKFRSVLRP